MKKTNLLFMVALLSQQTYAALPDKDFIVSNVTEFREALAYNGKRTIHFNVSEASKSNPVGFVLHAKDHEDFLINKDNITIDGSDAGAPVTLYGATLNVQAKNVKLKNIHIRLGADGFTRRGKKDSDPEPAREALTIHDAENVEVRNVSLSWGTDETFSIVSSKNITVIDSMITEPLNEPKDQWGDYIHNKAQPHGYCLLIRGSEHVLVQNVIFSHCLERSPSVSPDGDLSNSVLVGNIIAYNYGVEGTRVNDGSTENALSELTVIRNYYIPGVNTTGPAIRINYPRQGGTLKLATIFNYKPDYKEADISFEKKRKRSGEILHDDKYRLNFEEGILASAQELEKLLPYSAGAVLPYRDYTDKRMLQQLKNREGKMIDHEKDTPEYKYLKQATQ